MVFDIFTPLYVYFDTNFPTLNQSS